MFAKFDQKMIDFLTIICWWTEVRFEKNNLYWGYKVNIISHMFWFFTGTFILIQVLEKGSNFWIFLLSFFLMIIGLTLFLKIIFQEKVMKYIYLEIFPQGSPNPCRILVNRFSERIGHLVVLFFLCLSFLASDFSKLINLELMWAILSFFALIFASFFDYIMACDSMPPKVKEERKVNLTQWYNPLEQIPIFGK